MKTKQRTYTKLAAVAALALASMAGINTAKAQTYIATFDTDISANYQVGGTPGGTGTYSWDGTQTGPTSPTSPSGSEYCVIPYANNGNYQEAQLSFNGNNNLGTFVNVQMDLKVDVANSHLAANGSFGQIQCIINNWAGAQQGWQPLSQTFNITNMTGWQHITWSLAGAPAYANQFVIDIIGNKTVTNTCAYWIDNLALVSAALPPPTLNGLQLAPPQKGLVLIPATTGQYQRVMVYPKITSPQYSWYGQASGGNPVSYSFTITNYPSYGNYTAQMFFIPIVDMQYNQNDTSVDWNCTNDVIFSIGAESNSIAGGTQATNWDVSLATKTNAPGSLGNGNPNLTITNYVVSKLPLGTWTLTFNNNTDFTITSPDGSVVAASLPTDVADLVSGNHDGSTQMAPYMGIQNNNTGSIGMPAVMNNMKISGTVSPAINENFTTDLTNNWNILSDAHSDVFVNFGDWLLIQTWNTPNDGGYSSLIAAATAAGPWGDVVPATSWVNIGANKGAYVNKSAIVAATGQSKSALFKLIKRTPYQLQVLLPGMTNAPGTLSGYTGSPTPQSVSVNFGIVPITVNMCDLTWHVVNSSDSVTTASPGNSGSTPDTSSLSFGTLTTTSFSFAQSGSSYTVTATDNDNPSILPNTSPAVIVNP